MSLGETGGILLAAIGGRPVGIMGTGMRIPKKVITNADLEKMVRSAAGLSVISGRLRPPGNHSGEGANRMR